MALTDWKRAFDTANGGFVGVEITTDLNVTVVVMADSLTWDESKILSSFLDEAAARVRGLRQTRR